MSLNSFVNDPQQQIFNVMFAVSFWWFASYVFIRQWTVLLHLWFTQWFSNVNQICCICVLGLRINRSTSKSKSPHRKVPSLRSPSHKSKLLHDSSSRHKSSRHGGSSDIKFYSSSKKQQMPSKDGKRHHRLKKHHKTKKSRRRSSSSSCTSSRFVFLLH